MHPCKDLAETNVTFHGKRGTVELMTDLLYNKKSEQVSTCSDVVPLYDIDAGYLAAIYFIFFLKNRQYFL